MTQISDYIIEVSVSSRYLEEQSVPERHKFVFSYTINVRNTGTIGARLVARHWIITDSNGKTEEVTGDGVVGQQPWLAPGEHFEYSSGAVLETDVGRMRGCYRMLAEDGTTFDADIPAFTLAIPRVLH